MHDSVAHSTVSDALVRFATGPFADQVAQTGAKRAVLQARANAAAAAGTGRQVAALLQSQGSTANDTRVRAWVLGATLATPSPTPPHPHRRLSLSSLVA